MRSGMQTPNMMAVEQQRNNYQYNPQQNYTYSRSRMQSKPPSRQEQVMMVPPNLMQARRIDNMPRQPPIQTRIQSQSYYKPQMIDLRDDEQGYSKLGKRFIPTDDVENLEDDDLPGPPTAQKYIKR